MASRLAIHTFHKRSPLATLFWKCPYELRRLLYGLAFPGNVRLFSQLRRGETDPYALSSFDRYRCIFIHIPKTAGVSIAHSLFGTQKALHKTVLDYQVLLRKDEFDSYFKFAFVRNPWDRAVSAYAFLREGGYGAKDREFWDDTVSRYSSFDDFVCQWMTPVNIFSNALFVPQYVFICDPRARPQLDFVGRFENLAHDFEFVARKLGIEPSLSRKNVTSGRKSDFREYYTRASREMIARLYDRDVQLLNYAFDG
jgi:hypothetical protein